MTGEGLIDFIEQVSGGTHLRVEENLGDGFVRLRSAEAERRQAKHDVRCVEDIVIEMLRNARDASAHAVFLATSKEAAIRTLTVIDDGVGIPANLHERIFEPRVTSKLETMVMDNWGVHGRGMALYSIKCNVEEAKVACSQPSLGSSFIVSIDTEQLSEKTDQSSYPSIEKDDEGNLHITKGPHNIIRCALEFSLEHRKSIEVYLGSPVEVAATLAEFGHRRLDTDALLFCDDIQTLPLCERLAASADAAEFVETCLAMGLSISERTAHRILSRQIAPLKPALEKVLPTRSNRGSGDIDLYKDNRGLKLAKEDVESFSREMERAFEPLAERYYLSLTDVPKIRVKGDTITVRFQIDKEI
ncbi:MAG: ATP-binding protein [Coriobacteriales bacterium]|jgi:hypothetical protein|nr:ATP-binding protein [Coriobacteriales bacterium]